MLVFDLIFFFLISVQTKTCKTLEREPHPDPYYCKPLEREHHFFPRLRCPGRELTTRFPLERFASLVQHGTTPTHLEYPISAKTGEMLERELQRDLSPGTQKTR